MALRYVPRDEQYQYLISLLEQIKELSVRPDKTTYIDPDVLSRRLERLRDELAALADPRHYNPNNFLYITASDDTKNTPLKELGLKSRTLIALLKADFLTIGDVLWLPDHLYELSSVLESRGSGFGAESFRDLQKKLEERELHLATYDPRLAPPPGDQWVRRGGRFTLRSQLSRSN